MSTPATKSTPLMMRQLPFALYMIIMGAVGWLASGTLILERLELYKDPDHVASCDLATFISCTNVMKSSQAALLGFPNPFLGIVAFTIVIVLGVVLLDKGAKLSKWVWGGLQVGITAGLGLVGFFYYTSVYDLEALCPYCMIAWLATITLFYTITARNIYYSKASKGLKDWVVGWRAILIWLTLIIIAGTIFLQFFLPMLT